MNLRLCNTAAFSNHNTLYGDEKQKKGMDELKQMWDQVNKLKTAVESKMEAFTEEEDVVDDIRAEYVFDTVKVRLMREKCVDLKGLQIPFRETDGVIHVDCNPVDTKQKKRVDFLRKDLKTSDEDIDEIMQGRIDTLWKSLHSTYQKVPKDQQEFRKWLANRSD